MIFPEISTSQTTRVRARFFSFLNWLHRGLADPNPILPTQTFLDPPEPDFTYTNFFGSPEPDFTYTNFFKLKFTPQSKELSCIGASWAC